MKHPINFDAPDGFKVSDLESRVAYLSGLVHGLIEEIAEVPPHQGLAKLQRIEGLVNNLLPDQTRYGPRG